MKVFGRPCTTVYQTIFKLHDVYVTMPNLILAFSTELLNQRYNIHKSRADHSTDHKNGAKLIEISHRDIGIMLYDRIFLCGISRIIFFPLFSFRILRMLHPAFHSWWRISMKQCQCCQLWSLSSRSASFVVLVPPALKSAERRVVWLLKRAPKSRDEPQLAQGLVGAQCGWQCSSHLHVWMASSLITTPNISIETDFVIHKSRPSTLALRYDSGHHSAGVTRRWSPVDRHSVHSIRVLSPSSSSLIWPRLAGRHLTASSSKTLRPAENRS